MKKRVFCLIIILLAVIMLTGCSSTGTATSVQPASKTVVALVDFTGSTAIFQQTYLDEMKQIIGGLSYGDVIVVAKITGSSITEPELLIKEVLPTFVATDAAGNPIDNPILVKKSKAVADAKLQVQKQQMVALMQKALMVQNEATNSDIMSSLTLAQNTFHDYAGGRPVLVILSDMMDDSQNYNFYNMQLTDSVTQDIINKEKAAGRLPNLQGAKVYVVAAGTESSDKFFEVRNFWLKYFAATGANISTTDYSNTLLQFSE
jgi:hypothetical protein